MIHEFKGKRIRLALYRIHWKKKHGGGSSIASVYMDHHGYFHIAPCNWVGPGKFDDHVSTIKKMELITNA